ncbi:MAG: hypothetical protein J7K84_04735 [Deltaproteobacteria bacterium]|nr:hypothetical protein [Deltaproteobacteria bacterium]
MKRCPTCNAKHSGKRICHRCKTDLGQLFDIKAMAAAHTAKANAAYKVDNFSRMFYHARRSYSLCQTPESIKIFACAALLNKKFDLAFFLSNVIRNEDKITSPTMHHSFRPSLPDLKAQKS